MIGTLANLIPGFSLAKLLAALAILATVVAGYLLITNYISAAENDRRELARAQEIIQQKNSELAFKQAAIETAKQVAAIKDEFLDQKASIIDQHQKEIQASIERQQAAVEAMGTPEHMAEVSALDNGFSKGNERLTYRAKVRTQEISKRLEELSRHENTYNGIDPITGGNL